MQRQRFSLFSLNRRRSRPHGRGSTVRRVRKRQDTTSVRTANCLPPHSRHWPRFVHSVDDCTCSFSPTFDNTLQGPGGKTSLLTRFLNDKAELSDPEPTVEGLILSHLMIWSVPLVVVHSCLSAKSFTALHMCHAIKHLFSYYL